ncbi:MAG: serine/threonine-protein kinase [Cyanobacteria bacterium J06642_2]
MTLSIQLNIGETLYKYQLKQQIGDGHFGDVWLAHDLTLSRDVAVKILDESMAPVAENLKEAKVGNRLNHQNVVRVHYADVISINSSKIVLIAMEYHDRGSVVKQLNSQNFLQINLAIKIAIDILKGLEYLHENGLYHNDIKPSNILIGETGEGILTDYGISCISPDLKPMQAPSAYILHRAPETHSSNNISVRTDVY